MDHLYPLKRPSNVTVKTKDKSYTCNVDLPMGEPEHPFNERDIINKFHDLNPKVDLDVLKTINKLESCNMRDIMDLLNNEFKQI